jgi:hypothetical protein
MNIDAILSDVVAILATPETSYTSQYEKLVGYGAYIGALDKLGQGRVCNTLIEGGWTKTDAKNFISDCVKTLRVHAPTVPVAVADRSHAWPYDVDNGRLVFLSERVQWNGAIEIRAAPIADFYASITEEGTTEEGRKIYTISGEAVRRGTFTADIDAEDFSDERKLKAVLEAAAGARDPVRAGMGKHLGPAIKLWTNGDLRRTKRFMRTGWCDDHFLIPGNELPDESIRLPRKLPYRISPNADFATGKAALDALIRFMEPATGTIIFSHLFLAPLAALAGWRNERVGIFIKGRTGAKKSSTVQAAMSIYGHEFMNDDQLIKWGEGATRNAIMSYATNAHDLPFLIDNYKPTTGGGKNDFINLIHNIMEGGDKERLTRAAALRETKPIHTWPVFTGEDVPGNDPASIARILVLPFERDKDTLLLTEAQENAIHLSAIGGTWLSWLETEAGRKAALEIGKELPGARSAWYDAICKRDSKTINPMRVATNLATNWLCWQVVTQHPTLGEWAQQYAAAHNDGLQALMQDMCQLTTQALEANRLVDALREALVGGRVITIRDKSISPLTLNDPRDRDRFIGWEDGSGYYLLPDIMLGILERSVGFELSGISRQTLYDQLAEIGVVASTDKSQFTKVIKSGGKTFRVLHLKSDALELASATD